MSTALMPRESAVQQMEAVVSECRQLTADDRPAFERTFAMATAMRKLDQLITDDMMGDIMALQNSGLGFLTDKLQGGYPVDVVRRVTIEANLRGLHMVGNEVNIIAGRFYATKNGLERLVREWPGLTDLQLAAAVPVMKDGGALVEYTATWKLNGQPMRLHKGVENGPDGKPVDHRIPVRVNSGMGVDAILGKAKRKMFAAIYDTLTGSIHPIPEGEIGDTIEGQFTVEKRVQKSDLLGASGGHDGVEKAAATEVAAGPTGTTPSESEMAVGEYMDRLNDAGTILDVGAIWEDAKADQRLSKEDRAKVGGFCKETDKAIRKTQK